MKELVISKLSKSFGAVKALDELDFSAHTGEVHAIIGENGAGKSTFIKILSGVFKQDSGSITLDGKELRFENPIGAMHAGVGTVYQELSLIPDLDVAQNIFLENWPASGSIVRKKELYGKAEELFDRYGVEEINPYSMVCDLPLSQRQVIEIMKAISKNPEIVIMDEATSALSDSKVEWLLKLCGTFAQEGRLVLFISHRMGEIYSGCDRISVFRNGSFVGVRKSDETSDDEMVTMMLGRSMSSFYPEKSSSAGVEEILKVNGLCAGRELRDINFSLRKGEMLGLGGLAGQGQSALFLSLFGIINYEGSIELEGREIKMTHPSVALKNGIVLVPEDRGTQGLVLDMSIRENATIASLKAISSKGFLSKKVETERVNQMISAIQVKTDNMENPINSLSGGNQQKVVLGKFLLCDPKIMLLFDVTRGVDVGTKMEIYSLMKKQAAEGHSVLFYSTDLEELVNLSDRVMVFCDGGVSAILKGDEITKENILKASVGAGGDKIEN